MFIFHFNLVVSFNIIIRIQDGAFDRLVLQAEKAYIIGLA